MKKINKFIYVFLILICVVNTSANAQYLEEIAVSTAIDLNSGINIIEITKAIEPDKRIARADVWFSLQLNEGSIGTNQSFFAKFTLNALNQGVPVSSVFDNQVFTLELNSNQPKAYLVKNLTQQVQKVNANEVLPYEQIQINIIEENISSSGLNISLEFNSLFRYGYNLAGTPPLTILKVTSTDNTSKQVTLNWNSNFSEKLSYFQVQVLRLFNSDKTKNVSEREITTNIDWSKAATFIVKADDNYTFGNNYTYNYTIGEGSGFYVWRVRPVSDYLKNGLPNYNESQTVWSEAPLLGEVELNAENLANEYFFFDDYEQDNNYNYSKVYTEEGKIKESVTYANHLNQIKQTATWLPSQNVTLFTQTVNDNIGRPALVTMPVPVDGKNIRYKEQFIQNQNGDLYSSEHFDSDSTFLNPEPFGNTNGVNYYDGNQQNIPDAQGYPFTRTRFYNDGTGRPKEVSGVGETHRIKSGQEKRTTRYLYETATEEELVTLLGGEAPNPNDVFKTITIDPNDIATITYTNKEGQVIITCLTFYESDSSALEQLDENKIQLDVINKLSSSSRTDSGFISSKRINLLIPEQVIINYFVELRQLQSLCLSTEFDCNYELSIKIIQIEEDNTTSVVQEFKNIPLNESQDGSRLEISPIQTELSSGTYIIQKELIPQGLDTNISANEEKISEQVGPIVHLIQGWLLNALTAEELQFVLSDIEVLANSLHNQSLSSDFVTEFDAGWLSSVYEPQKELYDMQIDKIETGKIIGLVLHTPCCQDMEIPIDWEPPVDCSPDENGDWPDYEQYAIDVLSDCIEATLILKGLPSSPTDIKNFLYNEYLKGWKEGMFNEMVYNMLNDQYASAPNGIVQHQYTCDEVYNCWTSIVNELKNMLPGCLNFERSAKTDQTVSEAYDEQYANDQREDKYEKDHDSTFDEGFKIKWWMRLWISKKKISRRIRDAQKSAGPDSQPVISSEIQEFHLVVEFLNCTGYKFAKVLTHADPNPLYEDYLFDNDFVYSKVKTPLYSPPIPIELSYVNETDYYSTSANPKWTKSDGTHYYAPIANWGPVDALGKPFFPNIKNPLFAYKYFHYDAYGLNPAIEGMTCFIDPNDCFITDQDSFYIADAYVDSLGITTWQFQSAPCCLTSSSATPEDCALCYYDENYPNQSGKWVVREFTDIGRITCPYYHDQWSSGQLFSFFSLLKSYIPEEELGIDVDRTMDITLEDLINPTKWYLNTGGENENLDYLIPERMYDTLNVSDKLNYDLMPYDNANADSSFVMVEKDMYDLVQNCLYESEQRRGEVRNKLYQTFVDRCYQIGECRTDDPSTSNIIPIQDVQELEDAIIEHMKQQCILNTFSIEELSSRNLDISKIVFGSSENTIKLQYGMGGMAASNPNIDNYQDNDSTFAQPASFNSNFIRYRFDTNHDGVPEDWNPSWFQYIHLKQVGEWDFDITLPDKCTDITNELPDCSDNPDHFVDRKTYELNPNLISDENDNGLTIPVVSPAQIINVITGNSNQ
nr:hypothetical protein [uncultured Draconibacterium sp.]